MVYSYSRLLLHQLQRHCLLCLCPLQKHQPIFGLCHFCLAAMPIPAYACQQCGLPLASDEQRCGACITHPPAFDRTIYCTSFNRYAQHLVMRLKKHHDQGVCRLLADWLCSTVQQSEIPAIDAIIAVPMHWQRYLWRGNNHSNMLAARVAKGLNLPHFRTAVKKNRNTLPQRSLSARQRRRNLQGAFTVSGNVKGLHIAIVDDVMTTASTMEALAKALKKAGAAQVSAFVVARA